MPVPLTTYRFTVDEYHCMGEAGVFHEDDRVELINGQVVEMTPIGPRHARCVDDLNRLFTRLAGDTAIVRVQNPVVLGKHHEPQPDLALLRRRPDRYGQAHPRPADVLVVVEVAETSLAYDRDIKIPLYARAGIPEVWLVDLQSDTIHVYRAPRRDGYAEPRSVARGETLTALHLPEVAVRVADVLG